MSHRIRCKMICHSVTPHNPVSADNPMSTVRFGAVYSPDTGNSEDENAVFGKYTPYAEFGASWATPVAEKLEVGKAYYVDFTLADDQPASA